MRKYKVTIKYIKGNLHITETSKVWSKEDAIEMCKQARLSGAVATKYKFIGK